MAKTSITLTIDSETKEQASKLFESFGIDTDTAVNLFLHQAVLDRGLPFQVKLPTSFIKQNNVNEEKKIVTTNTEDKNNSEYIMQNNDKLSGGMIIAHEEPHYSNCSNSVISDFGTFNDDDEEIGCGS